MEDGEHAGLISPDDLGKLIERTVTDSSQQFDIVIHRAPFYGSWARSVHPQMAATPGSLRQPLAKLGEQLRHELVHVFFHLRELFALFVGQNGIELAVQLGPLDRQVGLEGSNFCGRSAHQPFIGALGVDRFAQTFSRLMQPGEQVFKRILFTQQRSFDLGSLLFRKVESLGNALEDRPAPKAPRPRALDGVGLVDREPADGNRGGQCDEVFRFHTWFLYGRVPENVTFYLSQNAGQVILDIRDSSNGREDGTTQSFRRRPWPFALERIASTAANQ